MLVNFSSVKSAELFQAADKDTPFGVVSREDLQAVCFSLLEFVV